MRKVTRQQARTGRPWTGADRMRLELMAEHQIPAERIAQRLRRTEAAVRTEARKQRVMLAPSEKQLSLAEKRPHGGRSQIAPRRSLAKASAPGRPSRSRPERLEQAETLF